MYLVASVYIKRSIRMDWIPGFFQHHAGYVLFGPINTICPIHSNQSAPGSSWFCTLLLTWAYIFLQFPIELNIGFVALWIQSIVKETVLKQEYGPPDRITRSLRNTGG